ncbi:MAG: hypothetical protein PHZ09_11305 [Eubacteriales bacterium]|nr:hypothetical protein [Eubacteriales bacterium]
MKVSIRLLAFILCMMVMIPIIAACADETNPNPSSTIATEPGETTEQEISYDPNLPDFNFEGGTFTILTKAVATYNEWGEVSIWTEAENGDAVNDAIFRRNSYIEEIYNIDLVEYQSGSVSGDITKSVAAADNAYDVVMPAFGDCGSLAASGNFLDLYELEYTDFSREWWDQRSISDLTIAGKLFFVGSDISTLNNDATWCTMFNKEMIADYTLTSPYELVEQNKWTYDNFYTMYAGVSADINGNGVFDADDIYANLTQNENYNAMYIGSGERLIDKDAQDIPVISIGNNERSVGVLEILVKIMTDEQFSLNYHTKAASLGYHLWTTQMFEESRGLFWITNLQIVIRLRNLETAMGIVPVPKYSETQESYSNVVWTVGSYTAVPMTISNRERAGVILEAMTARSRQLLRPAYYDIALNGKYLRDEESIEMLDIIISERVYDLGLAYGFGGVNTVVETLVSKGDTGLMSLMDSKRKSIQSAIDKTVAKFEENT